MGVLPFAQQVGNSLSARASGVLAEKRYYEVEQFHGAQGSEAEQPIRPGTEPEIRTVGDSNLD
jgi:hypothetical protein